MSDLIRLPNKSLKWYFLADFLLVGLSFYVVYYFRRNILVLDNTYTNLLLAYYGFWFLIAWIERKFQKLATLRLQSVIWLAGRTALYLLFLISFLTILMQLSGLSRKQVFGSCLLLFISESLVFGALALRRKNGQVRESDIESREFSGKTSYWRLLLDSLLLLLSFIIINLYRRRSMIFSSDYILIAYAVTGLWFIFSVATLKFRKNAYSKNIWYFLSPFIKSLVLMTFTLTLALFLLYRFNLSRLEIFGTVLVFGILELIVFSILYIIKHPGISESDLESIDEIQRIANQKPLELRVNNNGARSVRFILKHDYLLEYPKLYEFINNNLDLDTFSEKDLRVLSTRSSYNIMHIKPGSISLFINIRRLNDFRWLNRYLIYLHQRVSDGGYIVGNLETIQQYRNRFFHKIPGYLANILYIPDFIWRRVFPKIPVLQKIYFFITDGKNRALSKAEAFGRLHFCGFFVIAEQEIDNHLWFIARKVKTVSLDENPSYSLLIKLPRIGLNGELINIYKFRTMYPYSEYLQEYAYQHNSLDEKGKIKDDFRMTGWGKVFRKLWIDELPQIINWFRGEVSLVGVRALSQHFFDLYPKDMQLLRIQYKPGLVPPYYADMPKNFEEILESERRYLLCKKEKPFTTDIIYFCKAFYNIVFRHARSR
jgi:lipopolysaccharide/colanic/teichoic acid biosynthesis glycosyltransferase